MGQEQHHSITGYCVIVPTYNNAKTLQRVLDGVLQIHSDVLVVNDGATDATPQILSQYPQITRIDFPKNRGKGQALRAGFAKARAMGFSHAITIDSDGQHFPDDLPHFVTAMNESPHTLLIGGRNMKQEGVPGKSSFGNQFSNFWFWFETGTRLTDTQSGYRLYPLHGISQKFFTNKFEFEIEVIVRAAWRGTPVRNIPIKVLYDPLERVSHFRPFKDFTRISILNTLLVTIALLYIKPRDLLRRVKKKGLKSFLMDDVLQSQDSNSVKALSLALGVFVGISPIWGFHTVAVLFLATLLGLNKAIAFLGSNVSVPPMIPFIVYASLQVGAYVTATPLLFAPAKLFTLENIENHLTQYLVGSLILAATAAIVLGLGTYLTLAFFSTFKNKK